MRPTAPPPEPAPRRPSPAEPASPLEEAWPPEDDDTDGRDDPWPEEPEGAPTPWPDGVDDEHDEPEPWPDEDRQEPPPEDLFPDPEEPTDPAVGLPDERDPRGGPAAGRRILALEERVILGGQTPIMALCATGQPTSAIVGQLDTTGPEPVLRLRSGAALPAQPTPSGRVLLDLEIADQLLRAVPLALVGEHQEPDLLIGSDLLTGRFLVDPAGF